MRASDYAVKNLNLSRLCLGKMQTNSEATTWSTLRDLNLVGLLYLILVYRMRSTPHNRWLWSRMSIKLSKIMPQWIPLLSHLQGPYSIRWWVLFKQKQMRLRDLQGVYSWCYLRVGSRVRASNSSAKNTQWLIFGQPWCLKETPSLKKDSRNRGPIQKMFRVSPFHHLTLPCPLIGCTCPPHYRR